MSQIKPRGTIPTIFLIEQAGYCPKICLNDFTHMCLEAKSWFDKGQSIGVSYLDAPAWWHQALKVMGKAEGEAQQYLMEQNRRSK